MKKKDTLLQMVGETQNMSIYRKKNGQYGFRRKTGVDAERLAKDPNFIAIRQNAKDFGKAGKAGLLIKQAFQPMISKYANSDIFTRLTTLCKEVIKSDATHERGFRNLLDGDTNLFTGFEFNPAGMFRTTFIVPITHTIDRVAGTASIVLPPFVPVEMIVPPEKASHYKLKVGCATLNFDANAFEFSQTASEDMPLDDILTAPLTLNFQLPQNTADPVFLAISIEYQEEEGDFVYPILNSKYNVMKLLAVDVPA
ncbi:hypothetical protein [Chitinophaga barathri]|uniref:Uncharacterized protein n=1 Tax=Chitinophaga barathri TaxID=1647451 RepID=A0A3N4M5L1_9BACT|nr:hypothetical protein [Chitinophaga barathri]RPD38574.1 hypothetical protein EG028_25250 [Chitinophaga barathri]